MLYKNNQVTWVNYFFMMQLSLTVGQFCLGDAFVDVQTSQWKVYRRGEKTETFRQCHFCWW